LILKKINYKVNNESISEMFKLIDKLVYRSKDEKIKKVIYQLFLLNYKNKKLRFIFPSDISKIVLSPEFYGSYSFEKIIFINSKHNDILLSSNKVI
jgi:hypothetical protein